MAVRLDGHQLSELDELVRAGIYENRAAALRAGLEMIARTRRREQLAAEYRRGYRLHPQTQDDLAWVEAASGAALAGLEE